MWRLVADVPEQLDALVACAAREGVLFKRGAYQFAALAHDAKAVDKVESAMAAVVRALVPGPRRTEP
jgi:glutamate-1-semialdehyde 2,1-aminomutase